MLPASSNFKAFLRKIEDAREYYRRELDKGVGRK
jgi:hypothetical protein